MFANKRVPNLMSKVRILEEKKKMFIGKTTSMNFFFLKTAIKNEMGTKQKLKKTLKIVVFAKASAMIDFNCHSYVKLFHEEKKIICMLLCSN